MGDGVGRRAIKVVTSARHQGSKSNHLQAAAIGALQVRDEPIQYSISHEQHGVPGIIQYRYTSMV